MRQREEKRKEIVLDKNTEYKVLIIVKCIYIYINSFRLLYGAIQ